MTEMSMPDNQTSAPQPIDGATALRLLREVVAERPDYVYAAPMDGDAGCVYVWNRRPSCLVAHVLTRAGWPIRAIEVLDSVGSIRNAAGNGIVVGDDAATRILDAAQAVQDQQTQPWRVALAAAETRAALVGVTA